MKAKRTCAVFTREEARKAAEEALKGGRAVFVSSSIVAFSLFAPLPASPQDGETARILVDRAADGKALAEIADAVLKDFDRYYEESTKKADGTLSRLYAHPNLSADYKKKIREELVKSLDRDAQLKKKVKENIKSIAASKQSSRKEVDTAADFVIGDFPAYSKAFPGLASVLAAHPNLSSDRKKALSDLLARELKRESEQKKSSPCYGCTSGCVKCTSGCTDRCINSCTTCISCTWCTRSCTTSGTAGCSYT